MKPGWRKNVNPSQGGMSEPKKRVCVREYMIQDN